MPKFLDTSGLTSIAIAVCDRCRMKVPFASLVADSNSPGLRVCADRGCKDELDPYRLPARKTERINIRFPRPDVSVAVVQNGIVTSPSGSWTLSLEQNTQTPENNGNLDNLSPSP